MNGPAGRKIVPTLIAIKIDRFTIQLNNYQLFKLWMFLCDEQAGHGFKNLGNIFRLILIMLSNERCTQSRFISLVKVAHPLRQNIFVLNVWTS